jgi:hypothetical protein
VEVEDEAGPLIEGEGQIDLGRFYNEFIRPGRGIANVIAAVDDAAEVRLNELIAASKEIATAPIRAGRHARLQRGQSSRPA